MSSDLVSPATTAPPAPDAAAAGCPVPHVVAKLAPAAACPFPHDQAGAATTARPEPKRSKADEFVRKILFIKERPADVSSAAAYRAFQKSMLISATRCTLTYVVFPFILPMLSFASGVGSAVGIAIGVVALISDTFTIRRFFAIDHKWRWYFTGAALSVMTLLTILLVQDISHLAK